MTATVIELERLAQRLVRAWRRSDALFGLVGDGAWHLRPVPYRHPCVFYLGHLPAFAWNQIGRGVLGRAMMDPTFDALFERGIDPLSPDEAEAASIDAWPDLDQICAYRDRARIAVLESLEALESREGDLLAERGRVVHLVIEHELMHHETLLYILHNMPPEHLQRPDDAQQAAPAAPVAPDRIEIPGGSVTLGAEFGAVEFGWDNEFPKHVVEVPRFVLEHVPVTNARFLAFVEAGGYADPSLWTPEAWAWREASGQRAPIGWSRSGVDWHVRTLFERVPFESVAAWPVEVSHAEASAFARWSSARLPTEAELHRAAYGTPSGEERTYPWGDEAPSVARVGSGGAAWQPTPVGTHPAGRSAFGLEDLLGSGWQWTRTPFGPFPGFEAWARTYPGYSADFFDDRHFVVFGGSWATDETLMRRSFRNWYQGRYPYVFSAVRLAFDVPS